jgi:hypothetical protein
MSASAVTISRNAVVADKRDQVWRWMLVGLGLALRFPLLFAPLNYASDTWRQADTASIAHHFLVNGFRLFYPQIYWGGIGPGYVEAEFQLYPFVVALFYAVLGEQLWLGRLVSLLFTLPAFALFYPLARRAVGSRAALWALAFFVISPLYLRYSVAYMPEAAVMCFYVAALYFFQRWLDEERRLTLWLAAGSTALAILVKPTSIHIGLIFAWLALARFGWPVVKRWPVWIAGLIALLPGAAWYLHARNLYLRYGNTFGILSGGDSKFGNFDYWIGTHFYLSAAALETSWVFGGAAVGLFALGLFLSLRRRATPLLVSSVVTIFVYYLIVARYAQEEWGVQYHVFAVPFAALGVGLGFEWLLAQIQPKLKAWVAGGAALVVLVGPTYFYQDLLRPDGAALTECAAQVKALVPADARIIVSSTSLSKESGVPNNYQEPMIFFYSDRYGWSLPADWHAPENVEPLRQAGAGYFVIYSAEQYENSPELARYLESRAEQIGPGVEAGCGIYRFNP